MQYSVSFDVEVLKVHIWGASDCRRIGKAHETESVNEKSFFNVECSGLEDVSDVVYVSFWKNVNKAVQRLGAMASGLDVLFVLKGSERLPSERNYMLSGQKFRELAK